MQRETVNGKHRVYTAHKYVFSYTMDTYKHIQKCECKFGVYMCTHPPFLARAHHFTIMRTDLWPWGQMIVLNSITVRVLPTLHIHCSSTVTLCWCSSKINAPTLPPPSPLEAMFYMFSLIRPRVILIMSLYEWLKKNGWSGMGWKGWAWHREGR